MVDTEGSQNSSLTRQDVKVRDGVVAAVVVVVGESWCE